MKIAQVSPLWESVPPKTYGGTEFVVYLLCRDPVDQRHEVTLFASGDSVVSNLPNVELVSTVHTSLRSQGIKNGDAHAVLHENQLIGNVLEKADQFDVIHTHLGY